MHGFAYMDIHAWISMHGYACMDVFRGSVKRRFRILVPDPRLPGPGAGYPAAGPGFSLIPGPARLPGPGAGLPATGPAKKKAKNIFVWVQKNRYNDSFSLIEP